MNLDYSSRLAKSLVGLPHPLREIQLASYPDLAGYTRADIHECLQGQGGLFLAADMAKMLNLSPGNRVLDLACGRGSTSVFLARKYNVRVFAVDEFQPESVLQRPGASQVSELITPVRADARQLPFADEYFDAIFCMNSLFYFGTDDLYPPYILRFLKPGGEMVVGSPCYRSELPADAPEEILLEFPACFAVHSPSWWRKHFENCREATVLHADFHPRGVEFWEDRVKFLLDHQEISDMSDGKREMIFDILRMLQCDRDGFVSHFMMHLRKRMPKTSRSAATVGGGTAGPETGQP